MMYESARLLYEENPGNETLLVASRFVNDQIYFPDFSPAIIHLSFLYYIIDTQMCNKYIVLYILH